MRRGYMEINKRVAQTKKSCLRNQMINFIDAVLNVAEKEDKLDYIEIGISNHQGNVQMDYKLRDRRKAY
jgi:hypothetical protein